MLRLGLGLNLNKYRPRPSSGATGILDAFPGAAFAFSPDTLIYSTHSVTDNTVGSGTNGQTDTFTVRVRRSSDNAVQSFNHTQVSDGTLVTWVGVGNDGFVEAGYEQSGDGNHPAQSTAANQPKIVNNGSLVVENGKAALDFDDKSEFVFSSTTFFTLFIGAKIDTFEILNYTMYNGGDGASARGFFHGGSRSGVDGIGFWDGDGNTITNNEALQQLAYYRFNGSTNEWDVAHNNNVETSFTSINFAVTRMGRADNNLSLNGKYSFCIGYTSDQSSNRTAIETAINNEYNIY